MTYEVRLNTLMKEKIKKEQQYTCYFCKCKNKFIMTIDHLIPTCRGGTNHRNNLVCCCKICNTMKKDMTSKEFKRYLKAVNTLFEFGQYELKIGQIHEYSNTRRNVIDKNL